MKNRLQYVYSITVLVGVFITAYLMMNRPGSSTIPFREFQTESYRTEAQLLDPGVIQLIEMEGKLSKMRKDKKDDQRRVPLNLVPVK